MNRTSKSFDSLKLYIKSDEFGSGTISVCSYSTAWVARIIDRNNPDRPAFPQSVEWLRKNQLSDGSWGSKYPVLIFDRILSTLIAIICLKEWALECDSHPIEKAINYIEINLKELKNLDQIRDQMTNGFELILPVLIDKADSLGINFGGEQEQIIGIFREERELKLRKILACAKDQTTFSSLKPWCHSLEALKSLYSIDQMTKMVAGNGIICSTYSATAFALFEGLRMESSWKNIEYMTSKNYGGVPSMDNLETFDLAWSLNSLLFIGFDMNEEYLKTKVKRLEKLWNDSKGMIGGSIGLPPDADDIANSLIALTSAGKLAVTIESLKSLLKFFRNQYFVTFEAEKEPSISTNINCLIALKFFQHISDIKKISLKIFEWIHNKLENGSNFNDKWNLSPFYSMSRAIIAFDYIKPGSAKQILLKLLACQNNDGGWGISGRSSYLESSFAIISITYWIREHPNSDIRELIKKALSNVKQFMDNYENEEFNFWIAKTLYSPISLDKSSILTSIYALDCILDII